MDVVFGQIVVIVLITLIGYGAARGGWIGVAVKNGLTKIVLSISVPGAIIASGKLEIAGSAWLRVLYVFLISLVYHVVFFYVTRAAGRRCLSDRDRQRIMVLAVTFGNCMFVGFPVVQGIYGPDGLFLASIFVIPFNLCYYTIGVRLVDRSGQLSLKKTLLTPFNLSLLVMFVLLITQFKLPVPIQQVADMLGSTCTPLSLLVIGAMMADVNLKDMFQDRLVWAASALRIVIAPLIALGVMMCLPLDVSLRRTVVALVAMPGAAMTAMVAEQYDCSPRFASLTVVQSTLLFVGTFPLITYLSHALIV